MSIWVADNGCVNLLEGNSPPDLLVLTGRHSSRSSCTTVPVLWVGWLLASSVVRLIPCFLNLLSSTTSMFLYIALDGGRCYWGFQELRWARRVSVRCSWFGELTLLCGEDYLPMSNLKREKERPFDKDLHYAFIGEHNECFNFDTTDTIQSAPLPDPGSDGRSDSNLSGTLWVPSAAAERLLSYATPDPQYPELWSVYVSFLGVGVGFDTKLPPRVTPPALELAMELPVFFFFLLPSFFLLSLWHKLNLSSPDFICNIP